MQSLFFALGGEEKGAGEGETCIRSAHRTQDELAFAADSANPVEDGADR